MGRAGFQKFSEVAQVQFQCYLNVTNKMLCIQVMLHTNVIKYSNS